MTFSPFTDDQGNPKDLANVTFADLAQLADMDEGYVLEFKQSLTAGVKRKIPKIIASFANSREGGWSSASRMTIMPCVPCRAFRRTTASLSGSCAAGTFLPRLPSMCVSSPIPMPPTRGLLWFV